MALLDLIKNVPDIGKETLELIFKPRKYVKSRSTNPGAYQSLEKTFFWLIGVGLILLSMYSRVFGPLQQDVYKSSQLLHCPPDSLLPKKPETVPKAFVKEIEWWSLSFGVTINFEDPCISPDVPQMCVFHVGGLFVLIGDIQQNQFQETGFSGFILITLALVLALCIYPAMRILKRKADLKMLMKFSLLYISSFFLFAVLLVIIGSLVLTHVFGLTKWDFFKGWMIMVNIPLFFLLVRCYYVGYSELFNATKLRVLSGSIISAFISWAVSPLIFAPLLYIGLWLIPLYDLIVK